VEAATVHELHHNIAGAGSANQMNIMTATLGQYMIFEGLAESFSAELYGAEMVGPWGSRFGMARMGRNRASLRGGVGRTGFDKVRGYIFGDSPSRQDNGLPDYAGYALGYHTVQAYLAKTGQSVVEATYVPPGEIIAMSGFFD